MARRSTRLSSTPKTTPSSTTNSRKRAATNSEITPRKSKHSKGEHDVKPDPKKSGHFARQYEDATGMTSSDDSGGDEDDDESDFGGQAESDTAGEEGEPSSEDDEDEDFSDNDGPKRKKQKRSTPKQAHPSRNSLAMRTNGAELWRDGVTTGMEPGMEVIIKKPKARPAGKTPYRDDTIHPNTLLFLGELKRNNDRQWLKSEPGMPRDRTATDDMP